MLTPGAKARKARTAMLEEVLKEKLAIESARNTYHSEIFLELTKKAGIDFEKIEEKAFRRRTIEMRKIEQMQKKAYQRQEKIFNAGREELRNWLDSYLKDAIPVHKADGGDLYSSSSIYSFRPFEVEINQNSLVPGMTGGATRNDPAFWRSECDYELDTGNSGNNKFHPYVMVDNKDQHSDHNSNWLELVVRFEIEVPEGDYFLGERIWAPLLGYGKERFFEGYLTCREKIPGVLNRVGCQLDTIRYDLRIGQNGPGYNRYNLSNPADPDMDYIPVRTRPYCGGLDGGLYMPRTLPILFTNCGGFCYQFPGLLLLGRNQNGANIRVEMRLYFSVGVFYEKEMHEIDFREPNWLQIPWVIISGRSVNLG